jgi:GAF domain-containing protein
MQDKLLSRLLQLVSAPRDRLVSLQDVASFGVGPPEHPTFSVTKGLTGAAVTRGKTVNVGDVSIDPRYLTAFGSTRSEIIVPVFDRERNLVVGTIDVESEELSAFSRDVQSLLETCSGVIASLWRKQ